MNELEPFRESLARITGHLNRLSIPFHCTGGLVVSYYGEPRFTQDIDLVVSLGSTTDNAARLIEELQEDYILFPDEIVRAAAQNDMFQVIDKAVFNKIDFHVGEAIPGEFSRAVLHELVSGVVVPITAKEDAILSKLLWIAKGSGKSRQDVVMMLLGPHPYDAETLEARALALGVQDLLVEMRQLAGLL